MNGSYYQYHVFFCLNQRAPGTNCSSCTNCAAQAMQEYAKKHVKELGLAERRQVPRINKADCLDPCQVLARRLR